MSRLEAVEVKLSELLVDNTTFRIDDEMFSKKNLKIKTLLNNINTKKLIEISMLITDFGAFSQTNFINFLDEGILFLRNQDIKNNFIDLSDNVYISDKVYNRLSLKLDENDILIPRVGSLGKSAVVKKENLPCTANQNLAQIKIKKEFSPHYISTFLNTYIANIQINSSSTGNVQQWLNLENIGKIKIPIFSNKFQNSIEIAVLKAHSLIDASKILYTAAQNLLLSELGLTDYTPTKESISVKTFAESFGTSGRLDAEYYQPKYDEIENIINNYKNGFSYVKNKFIQNKQPYTATNAEHKYIEIGDVNISSGLAEYNIILTDDLPDNAKIAINKGDLIYSTVRPYRGAVALCDFEDDIVVSGAFTALHEKGDYLRECLFVLLRTKLYQEYIMKYNVGSSYPVVKDDDVLNLKIPNLPLDIQKQIADKIKESFALRKKSADLLNCAKQAVEIAIEQGEDVALKWLEEIKWKQTTIL